MSLTSCVFLVPELEVSGEATEASKMEEVD